MRVILVDDASLVRQGIARLLTDEGVEVVAQLPDASGLLATVETHNPDVVMVDVRMPPTHTTEGLQAALALKSQYAELGVLVLSQHVETCHAIELLAGGRSGGSPTLPASLLSSTSLPRRRDRWFTTRTSSLVLPYQNSKCEMSWLL